MQIGYIYIYKQILDFFQVASFIYKSIIPFAYFLLRHYYVTLNFIVILIKTSKSIKKNRNKFFSVIIITKKI